MSLKAVIKSVDKEGLIGTSFIDTNIRILKSNDETGKILIALERWKDDDAFWVNKSILTDQ